MLLRRYYSPKELCRAKHSGVEAALHQYFINTGLLSKEMGKFYEALRKERELTDYKGAYRPDEGLPEQRLEQSQEFIDTIRAYLIQHGYLNETK